MATATAGDGGVKDRIAMVIMVTRRRITANSCFDFIGLTLIPLLLPLFSLVSFLLLSSTSLDNIASDDVKLIAVFHVIGFSQLVTASIFITRTVLCEMLRGRHVIAAASPWHLVRNVLPITFPLVVTFSSLPSLHLALHQTTVLLGSAAPPAYFMQPTIAAPPAYFMQPTIAVSLAVSFHAVYFELIRILSTDATDTESTRCQLVTHSVLLFLCLSGVLLLVATAGVAWFMYEEWVFLVVIVVVTCPSFMAVFLCEAAIYKMLLLWHSRAARGDLAEVIDGKMTSLPVVHHEVPPVASVV